MSTITWFGLTDEDAKSDDPKSQPGQRRPDDMPAEPNQQTPDKPAPPKETKILKLIRELKEMNQKIREKERKTDRTKADVDLLNELNAELENFINNFTT